jgi:hypothetical protein
MSPHRKENAFPAKKNTFNGTRDMQKSAPYANPTKSNPVCLSKQYIADAAGLPFCHLS